MKPMFHWAGGKTQLLTALKEKMPAHYNNYHEPFIGGGALLLSVAPEKAFINDTNKQLINLYTQVKNNTNKIIKYIDELESAECNKEFYYKVRENYNQKIIKHQLDVECAALMLWINKHCFNGLYRVNKNGLFNVPYNNQNKRTIDPFNIIQVSEYFNNADITITCLDFEEASQIIKKNDFVYFDSPYAPQSKTAKFTKYTSEDFLLEDHKRLAEL